MLPAPMRADWIVPVNFSAAMGARGDFQPAFPAGKARAKSSTTVNNPLFAATAVLVSNPRRLPPVSAS
jgi:hypothetical protein